VSPNYVCRQKISETVVQQLVSTRADLVVVDDIGMLPAGQDAAEAFNRVIESAYEKRSVVLTERSSHRLAAATAGKGVTPLT
jgi:DNA replication protein DnaC